MRIKFSQAAYHCEVCCFCKHIIGPIFFDMTVNTVFYLRILCSVNWWWMKLLLLSTNGATSHMSHISFVTFKRLLQKKTIVITDLHTTSICLHVIFINGLSWRIQLMKHILTLFNELKVNLIIVILKLLTVPFCIGCLSIWLLEHNNVLCAYLHLLKK